MPVLLVPFLLLASIGVGSANEYGYYVKETIETTTSQWGPPAAVPLYNNHPSGTGLTQAPTPAPTPAPEPAPTPAPTAAPTLAATAAPTAAPTLAPTPAPTPAPVVVKSGDSGLDILKSLLGTDHLNVTTATHAPITEAPDFSEEVDFKDEDEEEEEEGPVFRTSTTTPKQNWWEQHKGPVIAGSVIGTAVLGGAAGIWGGIHASKQNKAAQTFLPSTTFKEVQFREGPVVPQFREGDEKEGSSSGDRSSGSSAPIWLVALLLICLACCLCAAIAGVFYKFCYKKKTRATRDEDLKKKMQQGEQTTFVPTPPPQVETVVVPETAPLITTPVPVVETVTAAPVYMETYTMPPPVVETITAPPVYMESFSQPGGFTAPPVYVDSFSQPAATITAPPVYSTTMEPPSWYKPTVAAPTAPTMTTFSPSGAMIAPAVSMQPATVTAGPTMPYQQTGAYTLGTGQPVTFMGSMASAKPASPTPMTFPPVAAPTVL